jgi:hypothetical protein
MSTSVRKFLTATVVAAGMTVCTGRVILGAAEPHPDFSGNWLVESVETSSKDRDNGGGFRRGGGGGFGGPGGGFGRRGGFGGGGGGGRGGDGSGRRGRGDGAAGLPRLERGQHVQIVQTATELTEIVAPDADGRAVHYPLDGSEGFTSGPNGTALKTKTTWDGAALVTESKATDGGKFKSREVRTLGTDGRVTIQTTIETGFGKRTMTATLSKQEG